MPDASGNLNFPIGDLAAGVGKPISITLIPDVPGLVTLSATASGATAAAVTATGTATAAGQALAPPSVVELQRYGYHAQPTFLYLTFSSPLNPASATAAANYHVYKAGRHGQKVGKGVMPSSARYDAIAGAVTLGFAHRLNLHRQYVLQVNGTAPGGLSGPAGSLNGSGAGRGPTTWRSSTGTSSRVARRTSPAARPRRRRRRSPGRPPRRWTSCSEAGSSRSDRPAARGGGHHPAPSALSPARRVSTRPAGRLPLEIPIFWEGEAPSVGECRAGCRPSPRNPEFSGADHRRPTPIARPSRRNPHASTPSRMPR